MSSLTAIISAVEKNDNLHLVTFNCNNQNLVMISLELNPNITIGTKTTLIVKPTNIGITNNSNVNISCSNQLQTTIKEIKEGKILCSIILQFFNFELESIITLDAAKELNLKIGEQVTVFFNASDLSIGDIIYD